MPKSSFQGDMWLMDESETRHFLFSDWHLRILSLAHQVERIAKANPENKKILKIKELAEQLEKEIRNTLSAKASLKCPMIF